MQAAMAAKKARELVRRKNVLKTSMLPGKLSDCSCTDPRDAGNCFPLDFMLFLKESRTFVESLFPSFPPTYLPVHIYLEFGYMHLNFYI